MPDERLDLETLYMELIRKTHNTAVSISKRNTLVLFEFE